MIEWPMSPFEQNAYVRRAYMMDELLRIHTLLEIDSFIGYASQCIAKDRAKELEMALFPESPETNTCPPNSPFSKPPA